MDRILRHWTLCIVTYSMMQWLQHGKAIKEFVKKTIDLWRRSNCMQDLFEKKNN
ncbi:MAG: hypothetical protein IPL26_19155 [Leptospiraceae bacterium]|nr:hypothetical protein [Leptospiraceae bacterium]MBK8397340.1 hypothetical protein [Leptospiraceae bacterium]